MRSERMIGFARILAAIWLIGLAGWLTWDREANDCRSSGALSCPPEHCAGEVSCLLQHGRFD